MTLRNLSTMACSTQNPLNDKPCLTCCQLHTYELGESCFKIQRYFYRENLFQNLQNVIHFVQASINRPDVHHKGSSAKHLSIATILELVSFSHGPITHLRHMACASDELWVHVRHGSRWEQTKRPFSSLPHTPIPTPHFNPHPFPIPPSQLHQPLLHHSLKSHHYRGSCEVKYETSFRLTTPSQPKSWHSHISHFPGMIF